MERPPCGKDCPNRYVTEKSNCHATCKEYLSWQAEHKAELARIRKIKDLERNLIEYYKGKNEKDYYKYHK